MPFSVLLGCQWGDEGKGKIVDRLAGEADWVVRFQGGANAGHTVYLDGRAAVLHLVPTGVLRPGVRCAIGNGTVIDPVALLEEIETLEGLGIDCRSRLIISPFAHLVTPMHRGRETLRRQDQSIGTTRRGIGPAYEDKAARTGLRAEDLICADRFREKLQALHGAFREAVPPERLDELGDPVLGEWLKADAGALAAALEPARAGLAPLVADVTALLLDADRRGERILCEGAQGTWLDIDHGTYPFVTSSNTSVGGACTGLGIPPQRIERVIGVVKAYCTRVGLGPFPTEFHGPEAERFRDMAGEFGATTGRPRRCGWFDVPLVRRSAAINGVTELVVTKVDVLTGIDRLKMATEYRWPAAGSTGPEEAPARWFSALGLEGVQPQYAEVEGWKEDLTKLTKFEQLPNTTRTYLQMLSEAVGVPVRLVSVGPGRDQVLPVGA